MTLPVSLETLSLGTLALLAGAVAFLCYVQRPTLSRPTVFASLPWLVTAAALRPLRGAVDYPAAVDPLLAYPFVYVLLGCLCALSWTLLVQLHTSERARSLVPAYLGLAGLGTTLAPFCLLVVAGGGTMPVRQLLAWLVAPVLALVVTYAALAALGLWLPRAAAFAGSAGAVVVFGLTLDAVVAALGPTLGGRPAAPILLPVVDPLATLGGVAAPLALVWAVVWIRIAVAVAVLAAFAALSRSRPRLAERALSAAVVASVLVGADGFVAALAGGAVA